MGYVGVSTSANQQVYAVQNVEEVKRGEGLSAGAIASCPKERFYKGITINKMFSFSEQNRNRLGVA